MKSRSLASFSRDGQYKVRKGGQQRAEQQADPPSPATFRSLDLPLVCSRTALVSGFVSKALHKPPPIGRSSTETNSEQGRVEQAGTAYAGSSGITRN
ncbi:unnamed protein product, partial [Iphiclides podalirius]